MKDPIPHESDAALCYLSAREALDAFGKGTLKPSTLLDALIRRIDRYNPIINALADMYYEEARDAAKRADEAYQSGTAQGALLGVPVLIKDAQRIQGKRTTYGSLLFMDGPVDTVSDPMIERLLGAGAIILGRTTTPEFCISGVCRSHAWGNTVNPHNTAFGTGGSSGGSGAALAAGFAPIATGTDIGGSIRIPSSCCGVVGFKPPHGRNPDGPPANFDRYNHCGPMARTVGDLSLVQSVVSGAHPKDHDSLREKIVYPTTGRDLRVTKIAYSLDLGYCTVAREVKENTLKALDVFRALGAEVHEVTLPWTAKVDRAAIDWYNTMHFLRQTEEAAKHHPDKINNYTLASARGLSMTTLEDVSKSWETQHEMYQSFGPLMEEYDFFICPTTNVPAVSAEHDPTASDFTIEGVSVDAEYGWVLTHQFNMLHHCPVMAVPSGKASSNVPTGIQIVGRTFDDVGVFEAALSYEAALGGWYNQASQLPTFAEPV